MILPCLAIDVFSSQVGKGQDLFSRRHITPASKN
jgi:hypothetical protein